MGALVPTLRPRAGNRPRPAASADARPLLLSPESNRRTRFRFHFASPQTEKPPDGHTQLRNRAEDTHSEMSIHRTPAARRSLYSSIALPSVSV